MLGPQTPPSPFTPPNTSRVRSYSSRAVLIIQLSIAGKDLATFREVASKIDTTALLYIVFIVVKCQLNNVTRMGNHGCSSGPQSGRHPIAPFFFAAPDRIGIALSAWSSFRSSAVPCRFYRPTSCMLYIKAHCPFLRPFLFLSLRDPYSPISLD